MTAPHSNGTTSLEAAQSMAGVAKVLRDKVFNYIGAQGSNGATDDEIEVALNLQARTENPRRWELVRMGLVIETKQRRKTRSGRNAIVWQLTGEGFARYFERSAA